MFRNQRKSGSGREAAKHVRDTTVLSFAESGPEMVTFRGPSANTQTVSQVQVTLFVPKDESVCRVRRGFRHPTDRSVTKKEMYKMNN